MSGTQNTDQATDQNGQPLSFVISAYAVWFSKVISHLFYPAEHKHFKSLMDGPDVVFKQTGPVNKTVLLELKEKETVLLSVAAKSLDVAQQTKNPVEASSYAALSDLFQSFMSDLQMLEVPKHGKSAFVKSEGEMHRDLEKEMERRARKGDPFCLVLARIDGFATIREVLSPHDMHRVLGDIDDALVNGLRVFDDVYHLENGDYIMSFKQTKTSGGTMAIKRLKIVLEEKNIRVPNGKGEEIRLTMSYCLADPVPGDTLNELIKDMREDLGSEDDVENATLEYVEKSPLQKFLEQ